MNKTILRNYLLTAIALLICVGKIAAQTTAAQETSSVSSFVETLAQAQTKTAAKQWNEAAALWGKVVAANPVNGDYWIELADARYKLKDYKNAIPAYEKAFEFKAGNYYNSAYNIACSYALLGDKQNALIWLEKALVAGFEDLADARKDADLQSLRDEPRFKKLVAAEDVSKMSREEGWRYDVSLLAGEIKRVSKQPFTNVSEQQFDAAVNSLLGRIPHLSDLQIEIELRKLVALLGQSH